METNITIITVKAFCLVVNLTLDDGRLKAAAVRS